MPEHKGKCEAQKLKKYFEIADDETTVLYELLSLRIKILTMNVYAFIRYSRTLFYSIICDKGSTVKQQWPKHNVCVL